MNMENTLQIHFDSFCKLGVWDVRERCRIILDLLESSVDYSELYDICNC